MQHFYAFLLDKLPQKSIKLDIQLVFRVLDALPPHTFLEEQREDEEETKRQSYNLAAGVIRCGLIAYHTNPYLRKQFIMQFRFDILELDMRQWPVGIDMVLQFEHHTDLSSSYLEYVFFVVDKIGCGYFIDCDLVIGAQISCSFTLLVALNRKASTPRPSIFFALSKICRAPAIRSKLMLRQFYCNNNH